LGETVTEVMVGCAGGGAADEPPPPHPVMSSARQLAVKARTKKHGPFIKSAQTCTGLGARTNEFSTLGILNSTQSYPTYWEYSVTDRLMRSGPWIQKTERLSRCRDTLPG
jgi:hypothetical protein